MSRVTRHGRTWRKRTRNKLAQVLGNRCCWCNGKMELPIHGKNIKNLQEMATIEHYFAIAAGDPDNIMFLRLAHERCNR